MTDLLALALWALSLLVAYQSALVVEEARRSGARPEGRPSSGDTGPDVLGRRWRRVPPH